MGAEEEEQATIQQSSSSNTTITATSGSRSLTVVSPRSPPSPPPLPSRIISTTTTTASDLQQLTSSFIPRRTRHRVDAGEPRGCFNNFFPANNHNQSPFRFLYSPQAQHSLNCNPASTASPAGPFLVGDNSLIHGQHPGIPRLYPSAHHHQSPQQQQQHRSSGHGLGSLNPHQQQLQSQQHQQQQHHHHHHQHHQQQQQQLLFYESQQREQQLKMLGELHHQQLLRDMLQKKVGPCNNNNNNNTNNNNNNNNGMGLIKNKSGYEEDCEEIARARDEVEKCRAANVIVNNNNNNNNVNSGSNSGASDVAVTSNTRINGCKKRKLYQPQRSDIDGKAPSVAAAAAAAAAAAEIASNSGGAHTDDEDMMLDEDFDGEDADGDAEMGNDEEFVKKEDEVGEGLQLLQEKVNRHGRIISENNNHSSQRELRSQHKNNSLMKQQHHHNNDAELLMNEISERKEKYGGLAMPQYKRSSPNFMQQQQQLAPITRHLLQQADNPTRSSPIKQAQHPHAGGGPIPIAQQQIQQLLQFRDSLKSTLIPHLSDFIDSQFSLFFQQQQQALQAQLALQQQQQQQQQLAQQVPVPPSQHQHGHHDNVLLNGNVNNGPRSLVKSPAGFQGGYMKQQQPHHQNLFTTALTGLYHRNGLYLDEMESDQALSLVVTPKKKRHKVTDTRLTPRAVHRLLESGNREVDRPTYISEDMSSPPLPQQQPPSQPPIGHQGISIVPPSNLMENRNNSQMFSPAAAAVAMYNAAILNGIQQQHQQQQQRNAESPLPTLLPTAVRDRGGDRDNKRNLDDYVQQLREMNNNSAGSADSGETVGSYDMRECGSSYGGQSITSTGPVGGTSSTLTPMHLRKAKLMFFWVRYPSSAVLKMYFPDIRFNKNNTAQLVKWFSNFREFYYIQMEKYSRQAMSEGIKAPEEIFVTTEHELYRVLNLHYNRNNHIDVPPSFRHVVEQTLREFFKSVQIGKDSEQSWKKAIYKIIARLDDPVPENFKESNFLEQLE